MKKKIMTIALALSALCVLPSVAKNPNNNNCNNGCGAGTCTEEVSCRAGRPDRQAARPNPFEGITLTPEQQTALSAIEAQRPTREQGDSTARAQAREARKEARRNYLNQVKEVLTPEQYVTFLENIAMQQGNRPGRQDMRQGNRPGRQELSQANSQRQQNRQGHRQGNRGGQRQAGNANTNK